MPGDVLFSYLLFFSFFSFFCILFIAWSWGEGQQQHQTGCAASPWVLAGERREQQGLSLSCSIQGCHGPSLCPPAASGAAVAPQIPFAWAVLVSPLSSCTSRAGGALHLHQAFLPPKPKPIPKPIPAKSPVPPDTQPCILSLSQPSSIVSIVSSPSSPISSPPAAPRPLSLLPCQQLPPLRASSWAPIFVPLWKKYIILLLFN